MLFSLTNLKRRTMRDPDDELLVVPKLLNGRAALKLLEQAIGVFEEYVGKPRSEFDARALEGVMGDYRLGRCIEGCLLTRYTFESPPLDTLLTAGQVAALAEMGLDSPTGLRLALWDAANAQHGGAVPPDKRNRFLSDFAQECGLPPDPSLVDALLARDAEASAVLARTGDAFTPRDLMRLYNRGAVQTLVAHSTRVEFRVSQLPGYALKRLYFVAKRRGVYVDIEATDDGYSLVLYGPEQASGSADKYGRRLAEVTLSLLRSLLAVSDGDSPGVAATAYLILHDREYKFHLTSEILTRLEYSPDVEKGTMPGRVAETSAAYSVGSSLDDQEFESESEEPTFDSLVEARLYKEFKSLERQGHTHGWLLQREPDPLLAPGVVLIPDFAFLRGKMRVFMEIAGFWSPGYREKKVAKLRALSLSDQTTPLILAMPHDATSTFKNLPYPIAPYKNVVRATDMLTLLDTHYGQREARLDAAHSQVDSLRASAAERGFVPEREVAESLQAYTRSELLSSARLLDNDACVYVAGVGLLSRHKLKDLHSLLASMLETSQGKVSMDDASRAVADVLGTTQVDIEPLLSYWSEWRIERPSLFEAYLVR